jgi:hypothetical protein
MLNFESHRWKKPVDPKVMTASKQEIINVDYESVVYSIHYAFPDARLFSTPAAFQNLRNVIPEMPVPSFCTQALTWKVAQDQVLGTIKFDPNDPVLWHLQEGILDVQ